MTFRRTRCPHCKGKLEAGQRIHAECIDAWAVAQEAKAAREADKRAKVAAKVDRAMTRKQIEANKTARELVKPAQDAFNAFIRERDKDQPCISCGIVNPPEKYGGAWDAGHFRGRGANPELRFDETNVHKQCKSCNAGGGKFSHKAKTVDKQYEANLPARIGAEAFARLMGPHEVLKLDRDTLRQIAVIYRAKTRDLRRKATT